MTMDTTTIRSVADEWLELDKEFLAVEECHRQYVKKVEEVKSIQGKCLSGIAHHRYRIKRMQESLKKLSKGQRSDDEEKEMEKVLEETTLRKTQFREMEEVLPHKNGVYLSIILGSVNVSLLSKADKFKYKEDYERFKLIICMISMVVSFCLRFLIVYRNEDVHQPGFIDLTGILPSGFTDAAFHFLLVWYYCTLTIREHILMVNGSRIKGWWITHHFISTVCAGILLIWPEGVTYHLFRRQFMTFSLYLSLVQILQYYYQKGCLYRLRALGERHSMDITVEGFQSWMWKGLSFVLPFLFGAYIFQLYNAYVLYQLSFHKDCSEWQVFVLSVIFLVLFAGNTWTTLGVVRHKLRNMKIGQRLQKHMEIMLTNKYRFNSNNKVHKM